VRGGSRFCPQCGNPLEAEAAPPSPPAATAPTIEDWAPPNRESAAFEQLAGASAQSPAREPQAPVEVSRAVEPVPPPASVETGSDGAAEALTGSDGAASVVAAEGGRGRVARVREGTRARVERMREEAIVVLEETPDDSGLRFVVAAAALFVLFLALLFLSTTILR
jgi:hypothetical protein